ncbi:hypothetical protein SH528x_007174 [Novipirellula sp. SH528]|uniref:hypothetical protein n=1 Tax=Novipirellula sp. SH528 TaxID=3454466 RepID=UPI003FA16620
MVDATYLMSRSAKITSVSFTDLVTAPVPATGAGWQCRERHIGATTSALKKNRSEISVCPTASNLAVPQLTSVSFTAKVWPFCDGTMQPRHFLQYFQRLFEKRNIGCDNIDYGMNVTANNAIPLLHNSIPRT